MARALVARGTPFRGVIFAGLIEDGATAARCSSTTRASATPRPRSRCRASAAISRSSCSRSARAACAEYVRRRADPLQPARVRRRRALRRGLSRVAEDRRADRRGSIACPTACTPSTARPSVTATGGFVTGGGRVIHMVAGGATVEEARERAYAGAERVTSRASSIVRTSRRVRWRSFDHSRWRS